jgi:hypothetical protein
MNDHDKIFLKTEGSLIYQAIIYRNIIARGEYASHKPYIAASTTLCW